MNTDISKKLILAGAGILILFVGIGIGFSLNKIPAGVPTTTSEASVTANIQESLNNNPPSGELVKVTRVIDGDTIEIEGGERVRYIGIDTPETVDPRKPVQCFGVEASKKNHELVEGKIVRLEKDVTDRDKYNRLLRYIWLDDTLINLTLVQQGFAHSYSYPPDIKYQNKFIAAEREARDTKSGLWNACPASTGSTTIPTQSILPQTGSQSGSCVIKGNINASGEKIYHLPGCGSYTKTQIDEGRGEKWFCSETEAQSAGWRKAGNCP